MRKHLATHKYPAALALVSIGILVIGVLAKPRKARPEAVVSETELMRLEQMARKRNLQEMSSFFSQVALDIGSHLVYVSGLSVTGVIWDNRGTILSARATVPAGRALPVATPDGEVAARPALSDSPVMSLRAAGGSQLRAPVQLRQPALAAGEWVLQVARTQDGVFFTPGTYRGVREASCGESRYHALDTSIPLNGTMAGGGLFDLDGRLLAIVVPCSEQLMALSSADVAPALESAQIPAPSLDRLWGVKLEPLDNTARSYWHVDEGLLIREIRRGSPADHAGMKPGDVVVTAGGEPVTSVEALLEAVSKDSEPVKLTVVRNRRKRLFTLSGGAAPEGAQPVSGADVGLVIRPPDEGFPIERIEPNSPAGRAGLLAGDRLLEVNGVRVRRFDDVARLLSDTPRYLTVVRGQRKLGILLP